MQKIAVLGCWLILLTGAAAHGQKVHDHIKDHGFKKGDVIPYDGAKIYQKCIACHGEKGEKYAMGQSRRLVNLTANTLVDRLRSYRDAPAKSKTVKIMQAQVKYFDDQHFDVVVAYIKTLSQ